MGVDANISTTLSLCGDGCDTCAGCDNGFSGAADSLTAVCDETCSETVLTVLDCGGGAPVMSSSGIVRPVNGHHSGIGIIATCSSNIAPNAPVDNIAEKYSMSQFLMLLT